MAAIANMVLNNGTTDVTFTPTAKQGNMVTWVAPATSVALQPRIVSDAKVTTASSLNRRVKYTIALPFVDTSINDVKSVKTGYINVDVNVPRAIASKDLTILRTWLSKLMLNAIIVDQIDNGANPY